MEQMTTPALGRTPDISDEEVLATINALTQALGKFPSAYAIKTKLGNRGNLNRYRSLLERYKTHQQAPSTEPVHALPDGLKLELNAFSQDIAQQLLHLVHGFYSRISNDAAQTIATAVNQAAEEVAALQSELSEADQCNQALEDKFESLAVNHATSLAQIEQLNQDLQAAQLKQQVLENDLTLVQERLTMAHANLETTQTLAAQWQTKAEGYEAERDKIQGELQQVQTRLIDVLGTSKAK